MSGSAGTQPVYQTSPIKRLRATKDDMRTRHDGLCDIVGKSQPMTVRQVFYQATIAGLVEKTESGYAKVQRDLVDMRRSGRLPYDWLADNTRWQRKPRTFEDVNAALNETARLYRKDLWASADCYVEIWLEKDALSGVVIPITSLYDVPLMVARGYASLSFLHGAAEYIERVGVPTFIYHLGDYDPSGVDAGNKIEQTLKQLAPSAENHFQRLAVGLAQIDEWKLPTRPTKKTDSRAAGFGDISVELDAIAPATLRKLVEDAIQRHLPPEQFAILKEAEASERKLISGLVGLLTERLLNG